MNWKVMTLAAVMFTGFLGAAPLDLSSYVTSGRKDTIKNTGLIVTNVDMVGMSAAITQYVGAAVSVNSVNGQTGTVTITASGLGALTNEADPIALAALSTNKVTKVFDTTGTRWIDGTGGVWQVTQVASTEYVDLVFSEDFATTNGHSPVSKRIVLPYSSGTGQTIACDSDGVYWAIHATIGWYGLGIVELEHFYNTPNYIKMTAQTRDGGFQPVRPALFSYTSGDGGPPSGTAQIEIHYNTVTSALPRVAFVSDTASLLSTNGNGSALTDMTVSQIAGAYPASNPSNFVTAADIRTPLVNVTTGATVTAFSITPTNRIYKCDLYAPTIISNDVSQLTTTGRIAEWELWLNAASTNALTQTFRNMTFADTPDMTVTGVYKIACSYDGATITARQIYPTRYNWTPIESMTLNNNTTKAVNQTGFSASIATNLIYFAPLSEDKPFLVRFTAWPSDDNTNSFYVWFSGYGNSYNGFRAGFIRSPTNTFLLDTPTFIYKRSPPMIVNPLASYVTSSGCLMVMVRTNLVEQRIVTIHGMEQRFPNENEKAFLSMGGSLP